jgi:cyanate permease
MAACRCAERRMFESGMWIIYLEMLAVLVIGALIVWWTMPRKKKTAASEEAEGQIRGRNES